ncbi:MAG: SMI1/KNR4 family protein [Janthinobacterium lividum]
MISQNWPVFLADLSQQVTSDESFLTGINTVLLTNEQRETGWLGKPGATEAELAHLEERLRCKLPPSYRAFLAASNGFGPISYFIYDLSSSAEIDWLAIKDNFIVELWEEDPLPNDALELSDERYLSYDNSQMEGILRPGHMRQCLMISDWGDAGFLALNPAQQYEGEWEAWHFANWHPGAARYRSFAELMQHSYQQYKELRAAEGG